MRFPTEVITANYLGLDLGQRRDYTALAVVAATDIHLGRDPVTYNFVTHTEFRIVHLERLELGSPYSGLPAILRDVVNDARQTAKVTLAVDATGPGLPVVEMIRHAGLSAGLLPAMITGGASSSPAPVKGFYNIARKDLLSTLRVAIETRKLKSVQRLPMKDELLSELRTLQAESAAHSRDHDDLVFAVALALWAATIRDPSALKVA